MRRVGEVEKLSNSVCSLKVVLKAFADGLDVKRQRKKRIKNDSEAIIEMQLPLSSIKKRWEEKEVYRRRKVQFLMY